jgi:Fe-S-cluster containining protein
MTDPMTGIAETERVIDPEVAGALRALYGQLDAEIRTLGVVCELSGRCCRFEEYGHTLFLSKTEANYLLSNAPRPARPLDQGQSCPWQDLQGRCTARDGRPIGCRVYFCNKEFDEQTQSVSERYLSKIKALHDTFGLPWNYAPLHRQLREELSDASTTIDIVSLDS